LHKLIYLSAEFAGFGFLLLFCLFTPKTAMLAAKFFAFLSEMLTNFDSLAAIGTSELFFGGFWTHSENSHQINCRIKTTLLSNC